MIYNLIVTALLLIVLPYGMSDKISQSLKKIQHGNGSTAFNLIVPYVHNTYLRYGIKILYRTNVNESIER